MQSTFTDLVGTAIVPAHCFDSAELTDLTPALDTATVVHGLAAQSSEAATTGCSWCPQALDFDMAAQGSERSAPIFSGFIGGCDVATTVHGMAAQASESGPPPLSFNRNVLGC